LREKHTLKGMENRGLKIISGHVSEEIGGARK
jgi:hypothetical protein